MGHVLVVGIHPLTVEVVKNLVCMGFLNITISASDADDLSVSKHSFVWHNNPPEHVIDAYLILKDFIKSKINPDARIKMLREEISAEVLTSWKVNVCVAVGRHLSTLPFLNAMCRKSQVQFIAGDIRGMMMTMFTDFGGNEFVYRNSTGNPEADEASLFLTEELDAVKCEEEVLVR